MFAPYRKQFTVTKKWNFFKENISLFTKQLHSTAIKTAMNKLFIKSNGTGNHIPISECRRLNFYEILFDLFYCQ